MVTLPTDRLRQDDKILPDSGRPMKRMIAASDGPSAEPPYLPVEGTDDQSKPMRDAPLWPKTGVGFGDAVRAEEGPVVLGNRSGARKNPLVGKQGHPVWTALDARLIGSDPSRYPEREPMFNRSSRRKIQSERPPPRSLDRKMAAAAGGERKSKGNEERRSDALHRSKPPKGSRTSDRLTHTEVVYRRGVASYQPWRPCRQIGEWFVLRLVRHRRRPRNVNVETVPSLHCSLGVVLQEVCRAPRGQGGRASCAAGRSFNSATHHVAMNSPGVIAPTARRRVPDGSADCSLG